MNTEPIAPDSAALPDSRTLDLARWLGRREAFGTIAGRCSAADVECLRQIRNQKLFRDRAPSWDDFCSKDLRLSRRKIDRDIGYLEEFGPQFFELAQLTRIAAREYRAIAPHVHPDGIHVDGRVIALLEGNAEQLAAAVADLCSQVEPPQPPPAEAPLRAVNADPAGGRAADPGDEILRRCDRATEALECAQSLDSPHRAQLARSLRRLLIAASRVAVYPAR